MTSIILSGANGKMCRKISEIVKDNPSKFEIILGVDANCVQNNYDFEIKNYFPEKTKADVIIDFSHPNTLEKLLYFANTEKIPIVVATTGYNENQIEKIRNSAKNIPIFFSFNMSLGVNLLLSLVKKSYNVLKDNFDIEIVEKHHNQKIDAPSGTALMIADAINEETNGKYEYIYNRQNIREKRKLNEIGIHSIRAGNIVGSHEVIFAGNDEIITISHTATSKNIFAIGAMKAAEFIKNKKPGLYSMKDLVNFKI